MSRYSPRIAAADRRLIFHNSGSTCQKCHEPITWDKFHVAHLRAASHGGAAVMKNLEAWCVRCNLAHGSLDVRDTRVTLRKWQEDALPKILEAISLRGVATLMAAPAAGKTIFAGHLFAVGQQLGLWNRILVLVPRSTLVDQWRDDLLNDYHVELDTDDGARGCGRELQ